MAPFSAFEISIIVASEMIHMSIHGHIIAMGGGGFSMEPDNPQMDQYVLRHARNDRPRVLFLCPGGDETSYAYKFFAAFSKFNCRPAHLSLFRPSMADLEELLLSQDVIYVGGGNTRSMLALWREWSLDRYLRRAWEAGAVLAGLSAGAICWFEQGLTDSVPGQLSPLACLGLLQGSCVPHYDGEPRRRPAYHRLIGEGRMKAGYAIDDGAALHFHGTELVAVIASQEGKRCHRVALEATEVREHALPTSQLPTDQG